MLSKLIGKFWNNITGQTAAMEKQQQFNADEAQKQRDFEAEQARIAHERSMEASNTAIQRQVADAEKAGINSAMLYANSASSGASTPSAPSARGSAASSGIGGATSNFSGLINSASNLARTFNYDKNRKNDVNLQQVLNTIATAARLFK